MPLDISTGHSLFDSSNVHPAVRPSTASSRFSTHLWENAFPIRRKVRGASLPPVAEIIFRRIKWSKEMVSRVVVDTEDGIYH